MTTTTLSPITQRFAWKEYRTLRGFWIAAFVLGALVQWFFLAVHARPPEFGWPTTLFIVALCTSALYAVGVAATTFSMEHEDETYSFLTGLPTRWLSIFAGKLSFALASSLALVLALTITGCLAAGGSLPGLRDAGFAIGAFGFLIVEALIWGTLFSLILRQPLLSALLSIAAVSASLTLLTTSFVEGQLSSLNASSYVTVLPQRILLAAGVFLVDILLARQWLVLEHRRSRNATTVDADVDDDLTASRRARAWARVRSRVRPIFVRHLGLRMFGPLLWQTWRQSWRWILGLPLLGALLCVMLYLVTYGARSDWLRVEDQIAIGPFAFLLITSALYACGVFLADQRGRSYRFLAEHAAKPRCVWISRLALWFVPLAIAVTVVIGFFWNSTFEAQQQWQRTFVDVWKAGNWRGEYYILGQWRESGFFHLTFQFALWGLALGFALGQACSIFFRRALVAGLTVGLTSVPCVLLVTLCWIWELSLGQFLLPIIGGLLFATWLRTPDWLVERNNFVSWTKVVLAIALPLVFLAWRLPAVRELPANANGIMLRQIGNALGATWYGSGHSADIEPIVANWVRRWNESNTPAKQATADRLQYLADSVTVFRDRSAAFQSTADQERVVAANREIIDEVSRLARQDYRLPLHWSYHPDVREIGREKLWGLVNLLQDAGEIATNKQQLDKALDYLLAALALEQRLIETQRSGGGARIQYYLIRWASADGQTSERLKRAIAALDEIYPEKSDDDIRENFNAHGMASLLNWIPPSFLTGNYVAIRKVIDGKEPSRLIAGASWREFAVILLNELPFERRRARAILADVFADQTAQWYRAVQLTNQTRLQKQASITRAKRDDRAFDDTAQQLRRLVLLAREEQYLVTLPQFGTPPYSWMRTSLLLQREFEQSFWASWWLQTFVETQVRAWGVRQQLALIAYRHDHGEYPKSLDALVPDYLPFVPIDPFSGRPFEYRPHGLEHETRIGSIPAGTPLLWSVDASNVRLDLQSVIEPLDQNANPGDEPMDVRRNVYEFKPTEPTMYYSTPEVFRLPK